MKNLVKYFVLFTIFLTLTAFVEAKVYDQSPDAQTKALEVLRYRAGDLNMELSSRGVPATLFGYLGRVRAGDFQEAARRAMELPEIRDAFKVREGLDSFVPRMTNRDEFGQRHVRLMQYYKGIPVWKQEVVVHLSRYQDILGVNGDFVPEINTDIIPGISENDALRLALAYLKVEADERWQITRINLVIYQGELCYEVGIFRNINKIPFVMVAARDGSVIHEGTDLRTVATTGTGPSNVSGVGTRTVRIWDTGVSGSSTRYQLKDEITTGRYIQTYYLNNTSSSSSAPGTLVSNSTSTFTNSTNGGHTDNAIDAHYYARIVYDYYKTKHTRNGIDNANMNITSSVWVTDMVDNAAWWNNQMWYGNVASETGNPCFNEDQDTVAHELTHGVTEYSANLNYENQSGALNESMSDVFAAMLDTADWMLFEDGDCIDHDGLRNMADPTLKGQPAHMSTYANQPNTDAGDWGGVHTNSGIPNKACHLLTAGGTFSGVTVTGVGYTKAEKIYYRVLTSYLVPTSDFFDARRLMIQSAKDLYGSVASEATSVANAWKAVGVDGVSSADTPKAVNDNATTTSTISIAGLSGTISSVDVSTDIIHTYRGDLKVSVKSPAGTTIILHNNSGGSAINLITTFDTLTAPYQSLSAFNGQNPNGTWTLTVQDTASGDTGTLHSWSLIIATTGGGGTGPTVSITAPSSGSTVSSNVSVSTSVSADVTKVEFYINGSLWTTDTTTPFGFTWYTRRFFNGSYSLTAKAFNATSNATSTPVSVTVNNTSTAEYESNSSRTYATAINFSGTAYTGAISSSTDNDYYKINVTSTKTITISLTNIPSGTDYELALQNSAGTVLQSSTNGSNSNESISRSVTAGTYYIRVYPYSGYSTTSYRLTATY